MEDPKHFNPSFLVKSFGSLVNILWVLGIIGAGFAAIVIPIGLSGGFSKGEIFKFQARLDFINEIGGPFLLGTIYLIGLFTWTLFLWIVYHLRLLIHAVKEGKPFNRENPKRIRKIACAVLIWAPVETLFFYLKSQFIINTTSYPGVGMGLVSELLFGIFMELVFIGLCVLVVAQISSMGVRLQQDQDLTI